MSAPVAAGPADALAIAAEIRQGRRNAVSFVTAAIAAIEVRDTRVNSVTRIFGPRAVAEAEKIDRRIAAGEDPGPLAGVPFGVKDLFDVEGEVTTAGSVVLREARPAVQDATVIARLRAAGAIPLASLNMDEFAYGFATDNAHYGITRNPHDPARLAGGSSGGSAAAVAAGFLPFTLGSDTNGSIRVPASLCGVWGLKPTFGTVPREGAYPFAASLDVVGPFAGTLADLRVVHEAMNGAPMPAVPVLSDLRVARLGGWFAENVSAPLAAAIDAVAGHLGHVPVVELPEVARARAASFLITAAEGGMLHLPRLRRRALQYDPATRDRLIAGALLPAATVLQAHRFRAWFREQIHAAFRTADVLIAPATVGEAPLIDQPTIVVDGQAVSARTNLGLYTQPLSLAGVPILSVPLLGTGGLPLGLQLIAAPGGEPALFAVAAALEAAGVAGKVPLPKGR
ncbi:amidohydrolase, AtzE family [Gluconacetobacter diazotrophicus PA1 5]|uniref:AtzE family amidohydrolase n=1 Tax=Gluconacetobacter diazotrophicus TaxID=33996 RepID=UPI000173C8B5|nr:AtzE family amidohydrolase [Gluconacetobacter diazotrophicus]ACI50017.1 amidohydrolase, AtzE family [Gluconacetobacter diazotrophicus PA1 5]